MKALVIVDLTPIDSDKLGTYSALAAETLLPYGGEFLAKGPVEALHGEIPFQTKVVIQFPDRDKAISWYQSPAYQAIVPVRDQGMNSQFHLIA